MQLLGPPALLALFLGASGSFAQSAEQAPQTVPDADKRQGETLTERLDRTDGVIRPPPVDAPMHVDPPRQDSNMPVIKPPAPAQDPQAPPPGGAGR